MRSLFQSPRTIIASLLFLSPVAMCQDRASTAVDDARLVLQEFTSLGATQIPESLLRDAQGVAIVPNVLKVGFVAGVRHGRGVVLIRDERGNWQLPTLIELTGGSFGWQAGAQSTDVVLVFRSRRGVENLLRGTVTLGADAAVAAGPVGRQVQAATDGQLQAEILSYSRSRGLFAGLALDGSVLKPDRVSHAVYYGNDASGNPTRVPESAVTLTNMLAQATGAPMAVVSPAVAQEIQPAAAPDNADRTRLELANSVRRLSDILDAQWKKYLEVPPEIWNSNKLDPRAIQRVVSRFDQVAADARYQALTSRREFQDTHRLLKMHESAGQLQLPPPPTK